MTDSAIKYVGVDGCTGGWVGVGLSDGDGWDVHVCKEFADLVACFGDACVILVDVPIGLPEYMKKGGRDCDKEARKKLKGRTSSVFSAPPKPLVKEMMKEENKNWKYQDARNWLENRPEAQRDEVHINSQTFSIIRNTGEVCEYLRDRVSDSPNIREAHPEVCFWAQNKALEEELQLVSKHEALGFGQRLRIVRCWVPNAVDIFEEVPRRENSESSLVEPDDVLDALALAITAKIGSQKGNEFRTLPKDPQPDSVGEMVYALPNHKGTPC